MRNEPTVLTDLRLLDVLHRRDVLGHSLAEIARDMGISRGTINRRIAEVNREMKSDNGVGNGSMPARWWDTPRVEQPKARKGKSK